MTPLKFSSIFYLSFFFETLSNFFFREINQAYDVLNNPEVRSSYDEYLKNPDKGDVYHYYNWYKAAYMPTIDPRIVVSAILLAFSILQYVIRKGMYEHAISCIEKTSKFKTALNAKHEEEKKTRVWIFIGIIS